MSNSLSFGNVNHGILLNRSTKLQNGRFQCARGGRCRSLGRIKLSVALTELSDGSDPLLFQGRVRVQTKRPGKMPGLSGSGEPRLEAQLGRGAYNAELIVHRAAATVFNPTGIKVCIDIPIGGAEVDV